MANRTISDQEAATTYCTLMAEVKGRLAVLHAVHSKTYDLGNDLARMEFCALLIRKSLEQIALDIARLESRGILHGVWPVRDMLECQANSRRHRACESEVLPSAC